MLEERDATARHRPDAGTPRKALVGFAEEPASVASIILAPVSRQSYENARPTAFLEPNPGTGRANSLLSTSDRKLEASGEGSKSRIYGTYRT